MILDTSAMVAILYREAEAAAFARLIHDADICRISVANYIELSMVIESQLGPEGMRQAEVFLRRAGITIEPVTVAHGDLARQAFLDFGKGRHKAGLNFGDCFSYALARATSEPLLFKGNDFSQTDIVAAFRDRGKITMSTKRQIITPTDLKEISGHCVFLQSVYTFATRIWEDSSEAERKVMEAVAPLFFADIGQVLGQFLVLAVCRITDPACDRSGRQNFTLEWLTNSFPHESEEFKWLESLRQRMNKLREKLLPARNKIVAHADLKTIRDGTLLGAASREEWDDFWCALQDFIRLLNEATTEEPFEINAAGVRGDAEMLIKALFNHQKS